PDRTALAMELRGSNQLRVIAVSLTAHTVGMSVCFQLQLSVVASYPAILEVHLSEMLEKMIAK
ncbi:MAG: hypothetical protein O3A85_14660, partial [Proteobacteria bacterium]|nr:hypothetical protein [Pseudomonadota bacterium]